METLLAPVNFFVWHPERCVAVAVAFALSAVAWSIVRRRFIWSPLVSAVAWLLFAWMEHYCRENGMNIRVDLFITLPIMFSVTLYGVLGPMRKQRGQRPEARGEGEE
jgi:hypothetical protein